MTRIILADAIRRDLERIADHLRTHDAANIDVRLKSILATLRVLRLSPEIGRPLLNGLREFLIGRGQHGYLALYDYDDDDDSVLVLRIRAQREGGYVD